MVKSSLIFILLVVSIELSAQSVSTIKNNSTNTSVLNSDLPQLQTRYLEKIYFTSVTATNELINGREYLPYYWRSGTNPLLFVNRNRTSTLFFRDMEIRNLSLQYDTYLDVVVYTDNTRTVNGQLARIALNRDNIK